MLIQEIKHVVSQASLLAMIIGVPVIENQFGVRIPNRTVDSHLSKDEKCIASQISEGSGVYQDTNMAIGVGPIPSFCSFRWHRAVATPR
jgi:hypothetical protein